MSKYVRKTRDEWDIQTDYGFGWATECTEVTAKAAKEQYRCYLENVGGICAVRKVKRRVRIDQKEA